MNYPCWGQGGVDALDRCLAVLIDQFVVSHSLQDLQRLHYNLQRLILMCTMRSCPQD